MCYTMQNTHVSRAGHACAVQLRQHSIQLQQYRPRLLRSTAPRAASQAADGTDSQQQQQQQGLVSLRLKKPVGIVFAQNKDKQNNNGPVFVEEILPGSNAEKSGQIQVGDVLSQCSAVVLKAGKEGQFEKEGYGQRPYDNWETILIDCEGREFKTVMNGLKSNNERWGINTVTLVFRKPATEEEALLCKKRESN